MVLLLCLGGRLHFTIRPNSKVDYSLSDFLSDKHIQIRESITEWRDAIRLAAQPLLEDQFIEKRYVERMIRAVEEFGNYMVILQ